MELKNIYKALNVAKPDCIVVQMSPPEPLDFDLLRIEAQHLFMNEDYKDRARRYLLKRGLIVDSGPHVSSKSLSSDIKLIRD